MRLRISRASLTTPLFALALVVVLAAAAEWAARAPGMRAYLVAPSIGANFRQADLQLDALFEAHREHPIECLVIGSSVVSWGVDPQVIDETSQRLTGHGLHCHALGLPAVSAAGIAALTEILAADYRPPLIVYGVTARDFRGVSATPAVDRYSSLPWVQYRRGTWSLAGWLAEHSAAYRQLLPYRQWWYPSVWQALLFHEREPLVDGHVPSERVGKLEPTPEGRRLAPLFGTGDGIAPPEPDLTSLEPLANLPRQGTTFVIVEVPAHASAATLFQQAERDERTLATRLSEFSHRHAIPFLQPAPDLIPEAGWVDFGHMNDRGAAAFSAWLGEQLSTRRADQKP